MNQDNKWSLYIAIGLPIVFLVLLVGAFAVPKIFAEEPQYDFIYKTRNADYSGRSYGYSYVISDGKISKNYNPPSVYESKELTPAQIANYKSTAGDLDNLYVYEVGPGNSRRVTIDEANAYSLDTNSVSPDGFVLEPANNGGGGGGIVRELFGGESRNYNTLYLKKGFYSKAVRLQDGQPYYSYYSDNAFMAWIKK